MTHAEGVRMWLEATIAIAREWQRETKSLDVTRLVVEMNVLLGEVQRVTQKLENAKGSR